MGFFGKYWKIDGVTASFITRGTENGQYRILFERENASLEQIEGINWAGPVIEKLRDRDCEQGLPDGYGFEVVDITYANNTRSYTVTVQTAQQYLGDVTEYQAKVAELTGRNEEQQDAIAAQEREIATLRDQLAEADELAIALYEGQAAAGNTSGENNVGEETVE